MVSHFTILFLFVTLIIDCDTPWRSIQPYHEIMALFVLRKFILQPRMGSHPVGLDALHTSCVRTAQALARLHGCAGSPELLLVA